MAGSRLFQGAFDALKAPKAHGGYNQSILQCPGTPPSPLSDQFGPNLDRIFNFDSPEDADKDFSEIDDDEVCPIDCAYEYEAEEKPSPSRRSLFAWTPKRYATKVLRKGIQHAKMAVTESIRPLQGTTGTTDDDVKVEHAETDILINQQTPRNGNHASPVTPKKLIFLPPNHDDEISDEDDDVEQDGSDDWAIIDMELSDGSDDELVVRCQTPELTLESAREEIQSCRPQLHPLCAAKYGYFFEDQPGHTTIKAY